MGNLKYACSADACANRMTKPHACLAHTTAAPTRRSKINQIYVRNVVEIRDEFSSVVGAATQQARPFGAGNPEGEPGEPSLLLALMRVAGAILKKKHELLLPVRRSRRHGSEGGAISDERDSIRITQSKLKFEPTRPLFQR